MGILHALQSSRDDRGALSPNRPAQVESCREYRPLHGKSPPASTFFHIAIHDEFFNFHILEINVNHPQPISEFFNFMMR